MHHVKKVLREARTYRQEFAASWQNLKVIVSVALNPLLTCLGGSYVETEKFVMYQRHLILWAESLASLKTMKKLLLMSLGPAFHLQYAVN